MGHVSNTASHRRAGDGESPTRGGVERLSVAGEVASDNPRATVECIGGSDERECRRPIAYSDGRERLAVGVERAGSARERVGDHVAGELLRCPGVVHLDVLDGQPIEIDGLNAGSRTTEFNVTGARSPSDSAGCFTTAYITLKNDACVVGAWIDRVDQPNGVRHEGNATAKRYGLPGPCT